MMKRVARWFGSMRLQSRNVEAHVAPRGAVERYLSDPTATVLVSFPRTGSHWLRMMMELYFERPALVRTFFHPNRSDYLLYHTHDLDLEFQRDDVLYLYREPVATIFSQLRYHGQDLDDSEARSKWTTLYGNHVNRWLPRIDGPGRVTLVTYEGLQSTPADEFSRVCQHYGERFDPARFEAARERVSKGEVARRTHHDPRVMNRDDSYAESRSRFVRMYSDEIYHAVVTSNGLEVFFEGADP